jgi:hypothetical protein
LFEIGCRLRPFVSHDGDCYRGRWTRLCRFLDGRDCLFLVENGGGFVRDIWLGGRLFALARVSLARCGFGVPGFDPDNGSLVFERFDADLDQCTPIGFGHLGLGCALEDRHGGGFGGTDCQRRA